MKINDSTVIHEMEVSGKMVEEVVDNDKMVIDHLQSPLKSVKSYVFLTMESMESQAMQLNIVDWDLRHFQLWKVTTDDVW